ncbi:MAG: DNA repair protein RecO [Lachnospiraceae bacterium]
MQEYVEVTGMILKAVPSAEFDRRITLLTKERGKITAFAKGARRSNSKFVASTDLFVFGEYKLYAGKNSYSLIEVDVKNYFEELRIDYEGAFYGMYFLEIMDYYTRENNQESEMLKLLYQSLRALTAKGLSRKLVQYIFEIKAMVINGEFPGLPREKRFLEATSYTLNYIASSSIEKLYTFSLKEEIFIEIQEVASYYRKRIIDREIKSLEIIENL